MNHQPVITETILRPHKSQNVICISHSETDGVCLCSHAAVASYSCYCSSHHHHVCPELQQSKNFIHVTNSFLIIVLWLEVALCYCRPKDLLWVHYQPMKFIPPSKYAGLLKSWVCHPGTELHIPSHNSLMDSCAVITLIGYCSRNAAVGLTEFHFLKV